MATTLKLKADIKKLKAAIGRKETPAKILPKLKEQLEKVENELASMKKGASPRKVSTTKGTTSTLSKLQKMVQSKKYSVYQGSSVDLKKDADEGAMHTGRRTSKGLKANQYGTAKQNKGNTYYEYRANRLDVKQPKVKQTYPKLEKGGETENERASKLLNKLKEEGKLKRYLDVRGNGKKVFDIIVPNKSEKGMYKRYESTSQSSLGTLQNEYLDENDVLNWLKKTMPKTEMASGGYMAKGGKINVAKIRAEYDKNEDNNAHSENVVLLAKHFGTESDLRDAKTILAKHEAIGHLPSYLRDERDALASRLYKKMVIASQGKMEDGGETEEEQKVIRGFSDDEAYEYAKGGMVEHGLKVGDLIVGEGEKGTDMDGYVFVSNSGKNFVVHLNSGHRSGSMKHGGELGKVGSKTHRYDK
jgi:hypothetical protein